MSLRSNGSYIGPRPTGPTNGIAGVASGIWDLRTAQRQRAAGAWPFPFSSPSDIAGLQLWLDASSADTLYDATSGGSLVAADGGVARWEDKSGNGRHATQSTSGDRPLRKAAIQGGKDVLRFDGSNDSLSIASSTATFKFLHSADSTVFVVFKSGTTANPGHSYYAVLYTSDSRESVVGFGFGTYDASPANDAIDIAITRGVGGTAAAYMAADNAFPSNTFAVASIVGKPGDGVAANRVSYRKNGGSAVATNAATGAVSTANSQADLTIGNVAATYSAYLNGDIAEIIIYDSALSDADREAVENYLLAKWAIS